MTAYSRQIQLKEVGALGQQRIMAHSYVPCPDATPEERAFAELYAVRCGLAIAPPSAANADSSSVPYPREIAEHFRHAPSRAVGVGAFLSHLQVMQALSASPSESDHR